MPAAGPTTATICEPPFVPCLELRRGTILVDQGEGFSEDFREVETAVIELTFDYDGVRVPASEARETLRPGRRRIIRDCEAEAGARRVLEAFGPIDLECLEDCATIPGAHADYAVHLEGDPDVLCSFSTLALPRLRDLGWRVDIAADYPCRVVESPRWYADLGGGDDRDWFELELGVEVDGRRIDLVPVLLELIDRRGGLRALTRSPGRVAALPVGEGRYVAVPPERLQAIVRVLGELYRVEGMTAGCRPRIPALVPGYLERLDEAFDDAPLQWGGDVELRVRAHRLAHGAARPVDPPPGLQAELRPYQQAGLAWLQNLAAHGAGGVLADDMGLGKTLQTIAHILAEKASGRARRPILVVAPTSLVGNWRRELARFAPSLRVLAHHGRRRHQQRAWIDRADVVITTYPLLVRDAEVFEGRRFHLVVLDEAQAIKNARSQAHRTVKTLDAELRLCLSGTPVENDLEELWALFDFVLPGLLGDVARFRSAFRWPIERNGNAERLATLRDRIAPFVLRRMKDRVVSELPPKTEIVRPIELRGRQRDLYEGIRIAAHATVRAAMRKKGVAASTIDILGALMKLRQVCCHPALVPVAEARQVETSAKLDLLFEMLPPMLAEGRRVLVFSQFTSMLALISRELERRRIPFCTLTGATSDRQAAVDAFQKGLASVFLVSLKAGGTGLNLTAADTVIHYDPWWNPAAQAQATDRAYRIGQTRPVFVHNLIVAGSVEERMLDLQRRKQALADGLLATSGDHGRIELSEREVEDLFAPLE